MSQESYVPIDLYDPTRVIITVIINLILYSAFKGCSAKRFLKENTKNTQDNIIEGEKGTIK